MQAGITKDRRGEKPKAERDRRPTGKLFGLIELDAAGTVLYSRLENDGSSDGAPRDVAGQNFYTEVAPFQNVGEFRRELENFSRGPQPAQSLDFTCIYDDGPLAVRVLLARIRERSQANATKSILVHIRKVQ